LIDLSLFGSYLYRIRYMNFSEAGTLIREEREKKGLTQEALARTLGMSRATVSKVENGIIEEIGVRKLAALCNRLGLDVVVRPRRPITLQEAYDKNRRERREAFRETDAALAKLKPDGHG
jgi:transcriptional regulator with XRE-family HTH domain